VHPLSELNIFTLDESRRDGIEQISFACHLFIERYASKYIDGAEAVETLLPQIDQLVLVLRGACLGLRRADLRPSELPFHASDSGGLCNRQKRRLAAL
jgi:hypothetical protein